MLKCLCHGHIYMLSNSKHIAVVIDTVGLSRLTVDETPHLYTPDASSSRKCYAVFINDNYSVRSAI